MSRPISILVIDDEAGVRDMLSEYLGGQGFHVIVASNGGEARQIMSQVPADLALLDVSMPGEDGLSLAQHFRRNYPVHPRHSQGQRRRSYRWPRNRRR